jgi:hypothetical protein
MPRPRPPVPASANAAKIAALRVNSATATKTISLIALPTAMRRRSTKEGRQGQARIGWFSDPAVARQSADRLGEAAQAPDPHGDGPDGFSLWLAAEVLANVEA